MNTTEPCLQFCSGDRDVTNDDYPPELGDVTEIRWWEFEDGPSLVVERDGDGWRVTSALPFLPTWALTGHYTEPWSAWDDYLRARPFA